MKPTALLFLVLSTRVVANTITSGTIEKNRAGGLIYDNSISMTLNAPGLYVVMYSGTGSIPDPPLCTGTGPCSYDFSHSGSAVSTGMATIGGVDYDRVSVGISFVISSSVETATVTCTGCGPIPFRPAYYANWSPTPFTMTGTVSIYDSTRINPWIYSGPISGTGMAAANSNLWVSELFTSSVTYTFDAPGSEIPEPGMAVQSTLGFMALAGLGVVRALQKRRS